MHSQPSLFDAIWERKLAFLAVFFVIFTVTYGVLYAIDFLPEAPQETSTPTDVDAATQQATTTDNEETEVVTVQPVAGLPTLLTIPSFDQEVPVLNPTGSSIAALDAALLEGAARHPDSAKLGEDGNILILGHSSYLPTVLNQNYQAFNGIQKLNWGDTVILTSEDGIYTYRVEKVYEAKESNVAIPTEVKGKRLTLITCNSFGAKEDRFIVEAVLISEAPLTKTALR